MLEKIKQLRAATGLGLQDCRKALEESGGDIERAVEILKQKGIEVMKKKVNREASEGVIEAYVHFSHKVGALVEVNCETDFVARNEEFKQFAKDLAMHITALAPEYISEEDITKKEMSVEEKEMLKNQCLLNQAFVKDSSVTIRDYLNSLAAKFGEKIVIKRFSRFSLD